MSRTIATTLVLGGRAIALAGCGYGTDERAASGGLLGAGTAAVSGGSPLTGALIGSALGAVASTMASRNDIIRENGIGQRSQPRQPRGEKAQGRQEAGPDSFDFPSTESTRDDTDKQARQQVTWTRTD